MIHAWELHWIRLHYVPCPALPCPALTQTHTHTHTYTYTDLTYKLDMGFQPMSGLHFVFFNHGNGIRQAGGTGWVGCSD